MEKEFRQYNIEFHANENRTIEGRAIPFNVKSPNREGFREMITPEAVEGVFEKSDVFMVYNHDRTRGFLARAKNGNGSLRIDVKDDGVYFTFDALHDDLSNYVYERLQRGDLDEMSWCFTVEKDTWTKGEDGVYDRVINRFDHIYDLSIVDQSYYGIENAVGCKRFAEIQEEERLANEKAMKEAEEKALENTVTIDGNAERSEEEIQEQERREAEEAEKLAKLKEYYDQMRAEYAEALKKAEEMNDDK